MKTTYDLAAMFHRETGLYHENHPEEYIKWLEGTLVDNLNKEEK